MRKILLVLFVLCRQHCASQDYRIYHTYVNNAERCFFLENKVDSTFIYYDKAFGEFDFAFVQDCFMAAQIACYKRSNKYEGYLKKGFKNGLRPQHLKDSPVFAACIKDSIAFRNKFPDYPVLRAAYLKRINAKVLRQVIQHVSEEQSEKNRISDRYEYEKKLARHLRLIESMISTVGFPGDKIIGIAQADIMHELGYDSVDYMDLYNLIYKDPKYVVGPGQYYVEEQAMAQDRIMPMFLHHRCIWTLFSVYWNRLIVSGQIHPRDVAILHDNMFRFDNKHADIFMCPHTRPVGYYANNPLTDYRRLNCERRIIDSMRVALFMVKLDVDSAKKAYQRTKGFQTFFRDEYFPPAIRR